MEYEEFFFFYSGMKTYKKKNNFVVQHGYEVSWMKLRLGISVMKIYYRKKY